MNMQEMPYERFMAYGAASLTNAELIAVILRTGTSGASAVDLARRVLEIRAPGREALSVLYDLTLEDLISIRGIGQVKAVKLLCLAELSRRLYREGARPSLVFTSPDTVARYYMEQLRHERQETVLLLLLDNAMALIREETLSIGTVNAALVSPREIFIRAVRAGAVHIILLHNHPSGDPTPSREDIRVTRKILEAGEMLEIRLADHLVIGDRCYTSMKEAGYLESYERE